MVTKELICAYYSLTYYSGTLFNRKRKVLFLGFNNKINYSGKFSSLNRIELSIQLKSFISCRYFKLYTIHMFMPDIDLHAFLRLKFYLNLRQQNVMSSQQSIMVIFIPADVRNPPQINLQVIAVVFLHYHFYFEFRVVDVSGIELFRMRENFTIFNMPELDFARQRNHGD